MLYKSSSAKVKQIGFSCFLFGVVQTYQDHDECYWAEQQLIKENIKNPLCLNGTYQDPVTKGRRFNGPHSEETKRKMSNSKNGVKRSPFTEQHRMNISLHRKGKVFSEETKMKMSLSQIGKKRGPMSEETKKKISEATRLAMATNEVKTKLAAPRRKRNFLNIT